MSLRRAVEWAVAIAIGVLGALGLILILLTVSAAWCWHRLRFHLTRTRK